MQGGAVAVGVLVLGRHFRSGWNENHVYLDHARQNPFDLGVCTLCSDVRAPEPDMPSVALDQYRLYFAMPDTAEDLWHNSHTCTMWRGDPYAEQTGRAPVR